MPYAFHHSSLISVCLTVLTSSAWAQSAPASNSLSANAPLPETVIVSATRIATPADQIGSSATVVTAADIAAKDQQTLPQILEDIPGLNVVQTGGGGCITSVFMRGTN